MIKDVSENVLNEERVGQFLIDRCKLDHEFYCQLLLNRDIARIISEAGFDVSPKMLSYFEASIKKVRTYITDQLHALETKERQLAVVTPGDSGNSAVDW